MAQGDLLQVEFKFNVAKHRGAFTLHYRQDNSDASANDDSCGALNALLQAANIQFQPHIANDAEFSGWEVRKLDGDPIPPAFTNLTNGTGTGGGEALPLTKAMVVGGAMCAILRLARAEGL